MKLADFGLARIVQGEGETTTTPTDDIAEGKHVQFGPQTPGTPTARDGRDLVFAVRRLACRLQIQQSVLHLLGPGVGFCSTVKLPGLSARYGHHAENAPTPLPLNIANFPTH